MLNFLFVEGLTAIPLYWTTLDMGSLTKDGDTLANAILTVKAQMSLSTASVLGGPASPGPPTKN